MSVVHKVTIHFKQVNKTFSLDVPDGENILQYFEASNEKLPYLCRNGCCTVCAVRIISGSLDQSYGIGLSRQMQKNGYALLCIAKANNSVEVETQSEDEVYQLQFGKYLSDLKEKAGNPFVINVPTTGPS